ncbi:TPM domain-containing protein [Blastococcus sp. HT6-30]|uniref:TPM domain-containing protein n=1 Tax=Blastococcus sp. HT6-30 TaxID=3144843 RepID=UPI00321B1696
MYRFIVVLGAALGFLVGAGPASAEPPAEVSGQLDDAVDVLVEDEEAQVEQALAELLDAGGPELYVVLVSDFEGTTSAAWVDETAALTGLGAEDMLFAIGVEDAEYEWWVDPASPLPVADVDDVVTGQVEPQVVDGSWTEALVALAEALQDEQFLVDEQESGALSDADANADAAAEGWSVTTVAIVVSVVAIVLLGAHFLSRKRITSRARVESREPSADSRR